MTYIKKFAHYILYTIEFIALFFCTYLTIALIGLSIPLNSDYDPSNGDIEIFVISNGVHTDICMPVKTDLINWIEFIDKKPFKGLFRKPHYISIGWGDKGFYLDTPKWSDLTFSTALNAAFLPSSTAMHVTYLKEEPKQSESIKLCKISNRNYKKLISYIKKSFFPKKQIRPTLIPNVGYTNFDNFYEAKGSYHLFRTCNTWTNDALAIAGVKTSLLALFEKGILRHL